jgi:hypothetical protein
VVSAAVAAILCERRRCRDSRKQYRKNHLTHDCSLSSFPAVGNEPLSMSSR